MEKSDAFGLSDNRLKRWLRAFAARLRPGRAAGASAGDEVAFLHSLIAASADLLTRHDAAGRVLFASAASHRLLGLVPQTLVGHSLTELVHPEDAVALRSALAQACRQPARVSVRLLRADDSFVWTGISLMPVAAGAGLPAGFAATLHDLSEQKARERRLRETCEQAQAANAAKSAFLAGMSHELRTPLNAILGFSEVMAREMFGHHGVPRYLEYSQLIHESGEHLLELINGVLDLSKIEAGKFEISEEAFALAEVVETSVRFVAMAAERGGVALSADIDPTAATIFADRRAVRQILVNLLSNAVKFTPRGGAVHVDAKETGRGIELSVSDTGTGIAPEDLPRLGAPFEQAHGPTAPAREGTGLGLSLVKALAGEHGGEVFLQSVLGQGTTATVVLPHAAVIEDEATDSQPFRGVA